MLDRGKVTRVISNNPDIEVWLVNGYDTGGTSTFVVYVDGLILDEQL